MIETHLDQQGALCPAPIIELGKIAKQQKTGRIVLLADDPAAKLDVPAWCRMRGATLINQRPLPHSATVEFTIELG